MTEEKSGPSAPTMETEPSLDDLLAALVCLEEGDGRKMLRARDMTACMLRSGRLAGAARRPAEEILARLESLIAGESDDPVRAMGELERLGSLLEEMTIPGRGGAEPPENEDCGRPSASLPEGGEEEGETCGTGSGSRASAGAAPLEGDEELLSDFVTESLEHIRNSEAALLALDENPGDPEALNTVFRSFHTVKGIAGFLNVKEIERLSHSAENLLERARDGGIRIEGSLADLALESLDMLKKLVRTLAEKGTVDPLPPGFSELIARLEEEGGGPSRDQRASPFRQVEGESRASRDVDGGAAPRVRSGAGDVARDVEGKAEDRRASEQAPGSRDRSGDRRAGTTVPVDETVRVSTRRLDKLIDMVGELVIASASIARNPMVTGEEDSGLSRSCARLGKITRELRDLSVSLRMVPLGNSFAKMARLVHDLSRKSGKKIRFVAEGEETEIDRNMVESIIDPLVHLVRNACDHGIEPPEERLAAGKPEKGIVVLRAFHAAGNVVVQVEDDGRGLDRGKILERAAAQGLIDGGREPGDGEILDLIFRPGFSTAREVTDVSGRGVGMDVVRKNVESLRGRVEVSSAPGKGSLFSISIPLTLAVVEGMILKVGREHYVLPTLNVHHVFRPGPSMVSTVQGTGEMIALRGCLAPLFRLYEVFGIPGAVTAPEDAVVVVAEHGKERCGILVDEILGEQQVVVKALNGGLGEIKCIAGATVLGDGRVGLILDAAGVFAVARSTPPSPAPGAQGKSRGDSAASADVSADRVLLRGKAG